MEVYSWENHRTKWGIFDVWVPEGMCKSVSLTILGNIHPSIHGFAVIYFQFNWPEMGSMSSRCQTHPNGWEEPRDIFDTCQWLNHLPKNLVWTFFERESVFFLLDPSRRRAQDLPDSHECAFGRGAREWSHHRKDRKVESDKKQMLTFLSFWGL